MAHIARALCGYSKQTYLKEPLDPTPKEALALINGVSLSAGISAILLVRAKRLLHAAVVAAGLTMEVVKANSQCIDQKVLSLRGHPDVEPIGAALRSLLQGSKLFIHSKDLMHFHCDVVPRLWEQFAEPFSLWKRK